MTITVATKKKLWALSGNKCSICKIPLIKEGQGNIGEECHIVAKKKDGARGKDPLEMNLRDEFSNLILLCANHHTEIDAKNNNYSVERLREIKAEHEFHISKMLDDNFLEVVDIDQAKLLNTFNSIIQQSEYKFSLEQLETSIDEYFDLDHKEQKTLYSLIKNYSKENELNVPKIARKIKDDLVILKSLKELKFLEWHYDINLLMDNDYGELVDYNENIAFISTQKYNWTLNVNGDIIYQIYEYLGKPNKFTDFITKIRLEFMDLSD